MVSGESSNCEMALNVWVPLSNTFRQAIQHATETAFVGRRMITTVSGETALLDDVLRYNQKAEGPLVSTLRKLESIGRTDLVNLIQRLYPLLIPYFIGCGTANPVHHTAYVVEFMVTILIGEGRTGRAGRNGAAGNEPIDEVKVCMLAALFHDMAQGCSNLPKITEAHIKDKIASLIDSKCTLNDFVVYRDTAIKARLEHMKKGAEKTEEILRRDVKELNDAEIAEICRIVGHHDAPKIPILYAAIHKAFEDYEKTYKGWRSQLSPEDQKELESILSKCDASHLTDGEIAKIRQIISPKTSILCAATPRAFADHKLYKTWHSRLSNEDQRRLQSVLAGRDAEELNDAEIVEIWRIVGQYDDPQTQILFTVIRAAFEADKKYEKWHSRLSDEDRQRLKSLLRETGEESLLKADDWLLQYHHEADLLWMVTQDGIEADLARFSPAQEKTWPGMIKNNVRQHCAEAKLYENKPEFVAHPFQNGTAYRSKTGHDLFKKLAIILRERCS